ncbi:MAG: hypothetical protein Q9221_008967, partial [Calogaya cf. arnoldii]
MHQHSNQKDSPIDATGKSGGSSSERDVLLGSKSEPSERGSLLEADLAYPGRLGLSQEDIIVVYLEISAGATILVNINRDATLSELKQKIHEQIGLPVDRVRMAYLSGDEVARRLPMAEGEEDTLSAYDISDRKLLVLMPSIFDDSSSGVQPDPDVIDQSQINAQKTSADYDEDLYIIDPQTHFDKLTQLEQDVLHRSEYFRTKREYSLSSAVCSMDDDGAFLEDLGLRASMQRRIRRLGIIPK